MLLIHKPDNPETMIRLQAALDDAPRNTRWIIDTETDGLDVVGHATAPNSAWYIGIMAEGTEEVFIIDDWQLGELPPSRLEEKFLVGHNLRFDIHSAGLTPKHPWEDTMVRAYSRSTTGRVGMDHLARVNGWKKVPTPDLLKQGKIVDVLPDDLYRYLADDCVITGRLWGRRSNICVDNDRCVEWAVQRMEARGLRLLTEKLAEIGRSVSHREVGKLAEIDQMGWPADGNLASPRQVGDWLTSRGYSLPRTKTGAASTSKLVLLALADQGSVEAEALLDWRRLNKLRTAFVENLPAHVRAESGLIHPRTNTTRTATGRFSCEAPNFQQIPKRGPIGQAIRQCITSTEGGITACDFSQVELRVAAALAQETVLLEAFAKGVCPHRGVAAKMLGKAPEDITPEERYRAKAVNFGILNGMGAARLSVELKSTKGEAVKFLHAYRRSLPKLYSWMEGVWREAEAQLVARTVAGRTRIFRGGESTRPAISVIVQGSAAELMRHALVAVELAGLEPILTIHDEILIGGQCPKRAKKLQEVMEEAANNAYPDQLSGVLFAAEVTIGDTWGDA